MEKIPIVIDIKYSLLLTKSHSLYLTLAEELSPTYEV